MSKVHIHAPAGYYVAQVRRYGCRKWLLHGRYRSKGSAYVELVAKLLAMPQGTRGRVLFEAEYYDPVVVMEMVNK